MAIHVWDQCVPGRRSPDKSLHLESGSTTLREILRLRIRQEVARYNESLPDTFEGLVAPEESERMLNGVRVKQRRPLDEDKQFARACSSFQQNGFLVLVDDVQVEDLDAALDLEPESEVIFVKLVPLVGG